MKRIFISGVISKGGTLGADEIKANLRRFYEAEERLCELGFQAVNPIPLHKSNDLPSTSHELWAMYLKQDIKALVDCDIIFLMAGWDGSRGARLELHIANELGLEVMYESDLSVRMPAPETPVPSE